MDILLQIALVLTGFGLGTCTSTLLLHFLNKQNSKKQKLNNNT